MERFLERRNVMRNENREWIKTGAKKKVEIESSVLINVGKAEEVKIKYDSKAGKGKLHVKSGERIEMGVHTGVMMFEDVSEEDTICGSRANSCNLEEGDNGKERDISPVRGFTEVTGKLRERVMYYGKSDLEKYSEEALAIRSLRRLKIVREEGCWSSAIGIQTDEERVTILKCLSDRAACNSIDIDFCFKHGTDLYLLAYAGGFNLCIIDEEESQITLIKVCSEPLTCVIRIVFEKDGIVRYFPEPASDGAISSMFKTALRVYEGGRRIPYQLLNDTFTTITYTAGEETLDCETMNCPYWVSEGCENICTQIPELFLVCEGIGNESRDYVDPDARIREIEKRKRREKKGLQWWEEVSSSCDDSSSSGEKSKEGDDVRPLMPRIRTKRHTGVFGTKKLPMVSENYTEIMKLRGDNENKINIGTKRQEGIETGLPFRFKNHVANYRKKELQKRCPHIRTGFLPGGLLHHTLGGVLICVKVSVYKDMALGIYAVFSGTEIVRYICMLCEYSSVNIPGRPYFVYDVKTDKYFIPMIFSDFFKGRRSLGLLLTGRRVVHNGTFDRLTKLFMNYLSHKGIKGGQVIDRSRAPGNGRNSKVRSVGAGVFYQSDVSHYPIDIVTFETSIAIMTPGEINLSMALGSIWPQVKRQYLCPDKADTCDNAQEMEGRDEPSWSKNFLIPEAVDPTVVIPSAACFNCDFSVYGCRGRVKLVGHGIQLPCGAIEHTRVTSLTKHRCLLGYLGVTREDLPYGGDEMIPCMSCGRMFGQNILAALCERVGCPEWPNDEESLIEVTLDK